MTDIPGRARVVIIGGGVIGTSVAYHLAQLGWTDVLLLEQGQLSCGTTWHAAGLVGQLRASENGTRLVQYSCELYERLEAETGLGTGFRRCGGVTVARTKDRMTQLKRTAATAEAYQLDCELISPARARELYPILRDDDLEGAIWLPGDGRANPTDLTAALARGARDKGVTIREKTRVTGILAEHNAVKGVRTDRGDVEAEIVVNCAGQWAKAVGAMAGVTVPLHSAEHFYVVTEQIDGVHRDFPILRDPDGYTYIKEEVGGLVVGGFEPDAKPWVAPDALPYPFEFKLLEEDWDHFAILMDSAVHRIPVLAETGIKMFYNGPESFTPDNQFILGEAPELRNFFVGAGFNSVGIASAGGAGRALAEWITEGEPGLDLSAVDIRRFAAFNGNNQWLHDRVSEVLGLHYAVPWPNRELTSARPFRRSPAYHLLKQANAGFGSKMGWERANFFAPHGEDPDIVYGWGQQNWQPWSNAEQRAARTAVALFDQTSFSKYLLKGPDAERALQWLCTADVAVPPGRTVYTAMLNAHGTYEADITVTRLSAEEFLLVSSSASTERDQDHIARRMPRGGHASLVDVTSQYAVYGVMGPRSRDLLGRLSRADLGDEPFPFGTSQLIDLGYATVRATRITYVGELGWELYVPAEFAVGAYEDLVAAGDGLGLVNAGYYAIESLRLEKAYRAFGRELTPDYNPVEAGLLFACKLKTDIGFLGREAVERARAAGPRRRLVSLVVPQQDDTDSEAMIWGGELVLRDGVAVGQITSGAWGETLGGCVALAYVRHPDAEVLTPDLVRAGEYQVNVGGRLCPARASLRPPFDPAGDRVRGRYLSRTGLVSAPAPARSSASRDPIARAATRNRRLGWNVPIAVPGQPPGRATAVFTEVMVRPVRIPRLLLAVVAAIAALTACSGPAPSHPAMVKAPPATYYLALGDSLAQGVQPNAAGVSVATPDGYADQVYAALHPSRPGLKLVKLGCPGETTTSMINGGICRYRGGSQLAAAIAFLQAHRGRVLLVTLDIGANDPEDCGGQPGFGQLAACAVKGIPVAVTHLGTIMTRLKAAAGPGVRIVGMNYYLPALAEWRNGLSGHLVAWTAEKLVATYNVMLSRVYAKSGARVANVFGAFETADFTRSAGTNVPRNVARLCQWTWQCAAPPRGPNQHANQAGYRVIARAFLHASGLT